ncbi:hypothetical protein HYH03_000558 [Edaphochlamys debaryana]|uniref:Uncharacterized protein n=1 Tax=Edaphochlamys debaryana TaxID=47281 RepID=A0A835YHT2_9CHLO|nr:hypothetical protein HYH03_000558 [Edaphochlamys debaryana]|eukprot:KAG2502064.1 hypothetical protein HYH03_000558 [Edaphochlamys debaryana]
MSALRSALLPQRLPCRSFSRSRNAVAVAPGRHRLRTAALDPAASAGPQQAHPDAAATAPDHQLSPVAYTAACGRLQELLEQVSWESEDDMVRDELANQTPEMKLYLFCNIGSILAIGAFITCWITGENPLGGFGLHGSSLHAAMLGAMYGTPLVALSLLGRLRAAKQAVPVLEDLHECQRELIRPIVADLSLPQLLVLTSVTTIPCVMLLLPALHGTLVVGWQLLATDVLAPAGLHLPQLPVPVRKGLTIFMPAVASGWLAAWFAMRQIDVTDRQLLAIREALLSADRHFLHTAAEKAADRPELLNRTRPSPASEALAATSFASTGLAAASYGPGLEDEAEEAEASAPLRLLGAEMAQAFRQVSILWILSRRKAAELAYSSMGVSVVALVCIWFKAHDLAAPTVAAMAATLTELYMIQQDAPRKPTGGST